MKTVTFISGLKKELVQRGSFDEVRYHRMERPLFATDGSMLFDLTEKVETKVAPILHICTAGREDVYVAYSEEVENLLGIPIRCIIKEKEQARAEAQRFRDRLWLIAGLSFWKRLVFLITRKLPQTQVVG